VWGKYSCSEDTNIRRVLVQVHAYGNVQRRKGKGCWEMSKVQKFFESCKRIINVFHTVCEADIMEGHEETALLTLFPYDFHFYSTEYLGH
jgi:hypothetical protein